MNDTKASPEYCDNLASDISLAKLYKKIMANNNKLRLRFKSEPNS